MSTCDAEILESDYTDWPIIKNHDDEATVYIERKKGPFTYRYVHEKMSNNTIEEWRYKNKLHRVKGPASMTSATYNPGFTPTYLLNFLNHDFQYYLFGRNVKFILHDMFQRLSMSAGKLSKLCLYYCYFMYYTGFAFYTRKKKTLNMLNVMTFLYQINSFYVFIILFGFFIHIIEQKWIMLFVDVVQIIVFIVNSLRFFKMMNTTIDQDLKIQNMDILTKKIINELNA